MTARMRDLENQEIGERRGEQRGIQCGEQNALVRSIVNLMETMKWTTEQAMDAIKIPSDQRSMYAGMINKK